MAQLNWKYAQNQFDTVTATSRKKMIVIAADHIAKLVAKLGDPENPDPDVQVSLNRVQPLYDDFELKVVTWEVVSGTRKGQTEALEDLLEDLSGGRIAQWDITIQNQFLRGTPTYTQILPQGRGPFQTGGREERIMAVHALGLRLAPFEQLAALRTTVDAFHATLKAARDSQQGTEGQIETASQAAEAARVSLAVGLIANVGRLMEKHASELHRLSEYFEIALLRSGASVPPSLPTFRFNWRVEEGVVIIWFEMPDVAGVANVLLREGSVELTTGVVLQPGQSQQVTWSGVTIVDDVDDVLLRNAANEIVAVGERDETLPDPGP